MSFLLKSPRLATGYFELARQGKLALRSRKIFCSQCQSSSIVCEISVRSCALAPRKYYSLRETVNVQEILYQKSISQIHFDIIFKGYTFRKDLEEAWDTLKSSTSFTSAQTALLIRICGHSLPLESTSDRLELVEEIWNSFDDIGIQKTIAHYNALLRVYIELEHKFSPKEFLGNLKKKGLIPNLETYRKLIDALSIQGNIGSAQDFLEDMKMHSVSIDERVFNSLILGYSLQGDFKSAWSILELMHEKKLRISSEIYVSLALGYAKRGDIDKVKEIVEKCKECRTLLYMTQFLELAYTFAVNGHSEHFSAILDMIPLKKKLPIVSTRVVHRLLHKKLDREALLLLEVRDKLESASKVREPVQLFLDHYVRFREPSEVLNIIEIYNEKGWSPITLAYCLKETLILKDASHCLNFLDTLKTLKYPVRIHYFYPILLKTHQSGNEEVLKMLRHMHKYNLKIGREMVKDFDRFYDFLPGAEFEDFEKLKRLGLNKKLIAWKILDILLQRQDFDGVVKLVNMCGIAYPAVILPLTMADAFSERQDDHEMFVYILYHLIHNLKANKMKKEPQAKVNPVEYEIFLIEAAKTCNKSFIIAIMQHMLKKKIPLSPAAASFVSEEFPCPEITDLVSKLTSADLEFEFDERLLNRLNGTDELQKKQQRKYLPEPSVTSKSEENEVALMMKEFEDLAQKKELTDEKSHENVKSIAKKTFWFASSKGDVLSTERIYKIGVQNNLIEADDFAPCVIAHLVRGNVVGAMKRFHQGLKKNKSVKAVGSILKHIGLSNNLALEDLRISISGIYSKNFAAVELLVEFAKLGYVQKARKILESKIRILSPWFIAECQSQFRKRNVTYFETLEKAARNIADKNLSYLYYPLLELYKRSQNLEKLLKLYVELERDDVMNESVRSIFFSFLKNWDGGVGEEYEEVFRCIREDCETIKPLNNTETTSHEKNIEKFLRGFQSSFESENEFVSNYNNESDNDIFKCFCLIHTGKVDEYFEALREKIVANGREKAKDYFFCYKLVPHMMANKKSLEKYRELVGMCESPDLWKKYLKLCCRLGNGYGIKVAIKNLSSNKLRVLMEDVSFEDCLRVVESKDCHKYLRKKIGIFYEMVIKHCLKQKNIDLARKYYEKAKKHKLEMVLTSFARNGLLKKNRKKSRKF